MGNYLYLTVLNKELCGGKPSVDFGVFYILHDVSLFYTSTYFAGPPI